MSKFGEASMTLELLRERELLAMEYLDKHWDELPCEELPLKWIAELAQEFDAALEDRWQEWRARK
ncbi:hypothetical protein LCGC14_2860620 [marine sediment metagenome]|uniref:Uncharacterized protein n=2 Tax=marine sediment metagenome TaxID=412755 RepID=A0A0F8Y5L9_9ZZZZ